VATGAGQKLKAPGVWETSVNGFCQLLFLMAAVSPPQMSVTRPSDTGVKLIPSKIWPVMVGSSNVGVDISAVTGAALSWAAVCRWL
jgi:hypothetical protein